MAQVMGEVDQELADFVMDHLRDAKGPAALVEGLEAVS
jgi:hypothetical protein